MQKRPKAREGSGVHDLMHATRLQHIICYSTMTAACVDKVTPYEILFWATGILPL